MTETPLETAGLTAQYTARVTADLERNAKEQDELRAEIDTLQGRLRGLQQDHTVLVNVRQALGAAAPGPASSADDVAVPSTPQQETSDSPETAKRTRARRTAPPQGGKQTRERKAAPKTTAQTKAAQPTLVQLIRRHLTEQSGPCSAAEVAAALTQAHPDRRIQTNVVRTTLEGLVAKSNAQRNKQGSSVYYTAPDAQEPITSPQADSEPVQADS